MSIASRSLRLALVATAAVFALTLATGSAAAGGRQTCTGDLNNFPADVSPLASSYAGDLVISGACAAINGPTVVNGNLTVLQGSTLIAAFGSGSLTVTGNVDIQSGGTMILGCIPTSFPCFDDPFTEGVPTLSSHDSIGGHLVSTQPLGVIVHNTGIQGNVTENGGGGGFSCDPPWPGAFGVLGSPVFSDYEDNTIGGNLSVTGLSTCWTGMARDQIGGNLVVLNNQDADPDGVEILSNTIAGNLVCQQNSMTWDSFDLTDALYPRGWAQNTVGGTRIGQCVVAPPLTQGGASPGSF
jgi:hypothetical protein